jgi:site-specific DNA-methyltransferase (adenine-specific)
MSELAIRLDMVPAILQRERASLAEISSVEEMAEVEKRAAAIADLTKRAGLAVPIQNEATFLRAEALELLAGLVDEAQENGEVPAPGRPKKTAEPRRVSLPDHRRVAEGRALARTGARAEAEAEAEQHPERPVSMNDILKRAKRREREGKAREQTEAREREAQQAGVSHEFVVADLREWRPEGVDSIITDPPYVGDSIPLYEALRDFAVEVLPHGGPLVVMTWQAILPDVIEAMRHPELAYRWTICWRYDNVANTADHKRRVFDCWKPILVYHKGEMPTDAPMLRDEIANAATDKDHHEWGQSVEGFDRLVRSFSKAGDVVCDPFLGGGTTAISALSQTRRFVGCDINSEAVATTLRRLQVAA